MNKYVRIAIVAVALASALAGCQTLETLLPGGPTGAVAPGGVKKDLGAVQVNNNATVELESGTYEGRLSVEANNSTIMGAGIGQTVLRGEVIIDGNSNRIAGVTIVGTVTITGNKNDLSESDVSGAEVSADGNNNVY